MSAVNVCRGAGSMRAGRMPVPQAREAGRLRYERFIWKGGLLFSNIIGRIAGGTATILEARALADPLWRR